MNFWDFYAADRATFVDRVASLGVPVLPVGGILVPIEEAAAVAYGQPAGQLGMLVRLLISGSTARGEPTVVGALASDLNQQAQSAGFGQGGGFGGSFSFRSEPDVAALIIPNTIRVAIEALSGGQVITNVVGVSGGGSGAAAAAAAAVKAAWENASGPISGLGSQYVLTGYRALDLSSPNGDIAFVSSGTAGQGAAAQLATNGACALVKWNGGTRSRSSRGRLYFGPLRELQINTDGRTLVSGSLSGIAAAFTVFRSSLASAGYPLVVISPTLSQSFAVTSHAVESVIATQRRRIRS